MTDTWPDQLALATVIIDRSASPDRPAYPQWIDDQIKAAAADTETLMCRTDTTVRALMPDEHWSGMRTRHPRRDQQIHLLAAMLGVTHVCPHLRRGGPQPAIVRLCLRRAECQRCANTWRNPPTDEDDRCDFCGRRNVVTFVPLFLSSGPHLVGGDACTQCAAVLDCTRKAANQ